MIIAGMIQAPKGKCSCTDIYTRQLNADENEVASLSNIRFVPAEFQQFLLLIYMLFTTVGLGLQPSDN